MDVFLCDFPLVSRPKRRLEYGDSNEYCVYGTNEQSCYKKKKPNISSEQSIRIGVEIMKKNTNNRWQPKFIPGISATHTRLPMLNIPRRMDKRNKLSETSTSEKNNFIGTLNRPKSPYLYSKTYMINHHILQVEESIQTMQALRDEAFAIANL